MIVEKAVKMAELMEVPILGIVENMSYFECPDCGKRHNIFGDSHIEEIASKYGIKAIAKLPIRSEMSALCDGGRLEEAQCDELAPMLDAVEKL